MAYKYEIHSLLGKIILRSDDGQALSGLWFEGQSHFPKDFGTWEQKECPIFLKTEAYLTEYFAGKKPDLHIPLLLNGTPFQQSVWNRLQAVPYGQLVTYGMLSGKISEAQAHPTSPRAVGNAVGKNPISIIIPCHRVVGSDGKLTGYAGGLDRKKFLLELEHSYNGLKIVPSALSAK